MSNPSTTTIVGLFLNAMVAAFGWLPVVERKVVSALQLHLVAEIFTENKSDTASLVLN